MLGLIALVVILLHFSVRAYITLDGEKLDLKVKYLWFNIYPRTEKKKKTNKRIKKKKTKNIETTALAETTTLAEDNPAVFVEDNPAVKDEVAPKQEPKAEEIPPQKPESKAELKEEKKLEKADKKSVKNKLSDLKEKWLKIKPYIPISWKAVKKLLKNIRFKNTSIELSVGKEDAYESAMLYGKVNAGLYNGLAILGQIFTMHYKGTKVNCVFNENVFKYSLSTKICVRPSTIIAIAFCTLVNYLKIFIKQKRQEKKNKKIQNTINNEMECA